MTGPRVLADFHHHALAESLLMLFGDRLGGSVAFPAGMEWFDRWYWSFERQAHGDAVARQYLEGIWAGARDMGDGTVLRDDPRYPGRQHVGVGLDAALASSWDYVVVTLTHNYDGFAKLAAATGAQLVVQVGNEGQHVDPRAAGILLSATAPGLGPEQMGRRVEVGGRPAVMYHQEFSLEDFRFEWPPSGARSVASFVNCFPEGPSYPDFSAFAAQHRDEFDFRVYGAYGWGQPDPWRAGDLGPVPDVAAAMRATRVGWHSKHWSDGYGHVIHNWFAVGRPVIGYRRYYADKLAGPLWVEGETSFDLARMTGSALLALLRRLRDDDDYHRRICEAAAARFRQLVDFGAEAGAIAEMLGIRVPEAVA